MNKEEVENYIAELESMFELSELEEHSRNILKVGNYIKQLQNENKRLKDKLNKILEEIDWVEHLVDTCDRVEIMKSVQEYIKLCNEGKIESSIYTSKDELGRMVIIRIQKDAGAVVSTLQSNGLLDEAVECGEVYKPKPGYYSRTNFDVDKTTGEPTKMWKEDELYNKDFWIPIYQTENFRHFVEAKFAFEDQELISSSENVLAMINSPAQATTADGEITPEELKHLIDENKDDVIEVITESKELVKDIVDKTSNKNN